MTVAALYVETDGVYFGLPDVEPWDAVRDARTYAGPWPVVAHPPCHKWSPLAYINAKRLPGYKLGDDGGCFEAALRAVETYGGVLEHPAESVAWRTFALPKPVRGGWNVALHGRPGWATEVDQAAYGHRARKRTWLYYIGGVGRYGPGSPPRLDWREVEGTATVSGFLHHGRGEYQADESRRVRPKEASRTPVAFRDALLDMARAVSNQESGQS